MADFGSPVVNGSTASNPMQSLTDVMNLKRGQLALQSGQQGLQIGAQDLQQKQIATQQQQVAFREQQALGKLDTKKYLGADGVMDAQSYARDAIAAAPQSGLGFERASKAFEVQHAQLGVQSAGQDLNEKQRKDASNVLETAAQRKDGNFADVLKAAEDYKKANPEASGLMDRITGTLSKDEPWERTAQKIHSMNVALRGVGTPATGTMTAASGKTIGTTQSPITGDLQTAPGAGVQGGVAPTLATSTGGQPAVVSSGGLRLLPQVGGNPAASPAAGGGGPRSATDDAPAANAPRAVQDAYATATQKANEHAEAVRSADEGYGNNKAISSAVRRLAGDATTGPGTETWNHIMGTLGTNGANSYQELGAFLDRQAATVRGQMGLPGTNAGAEDAKMIAGNTKYNAKVIQDKNDYTEALTEGLHQYRNGLDRVAGFGGQASPTQVSKFKAAWTNAFDPNVFIGENAYKRSKADGDKFIASLDPKEAASLSAKRKALQELAAGKMSQ